MRRGCEDVKPIGSPTRQQFRDLAFLRLREAEIHLAAEHYNGAAYLSGYALEAALKACICRTLGLEQYPTPGAYRGVFAVHDFEQLLFLSGLRAFLDEDEVAKASWSTALPWRDLRYRPAGEISRAEAGDILGAIGDQETGVLRWLETYW